MRFSFNLAYLSLTPPPHPPSKKKKKNILLTPLTLHVYTYNVSNNMPTSEFNYY